MKFNILDIETSNPEHDSTWQIQYNAAVQQVMGHASMQVTLGYLRNLEVPVLRVEDMPL